MKLRTVACGAALLGATAVSAAKPGMPVDKIYGVNLGSWLLSESWMFPNEWQAMGGEVCDDCSTCASTEFDLVKKLGQDQADQVFAKHWSTWFTQVNVNAIADAGLNTVRIPLGYWIVEDLVDRSTEFYPRGGMKYLKDGLRMLKAKNINVILDLHALPGVAAIKQMFAGQCTTNVQFYTEKNYQRALQWASVMTAMIYMDSDFSTVFSIEAVNEPIMDANQTPGLGQYQVNFVKTVRATEKALGIQCSGNWPFNPPTITSAVSGLGDIAADDSTCAVVASALNFAAKALPGIMAQLDSSHHYHHRAEGSDNVGVQKRSGTVDVWVPVGPGIGHNAPFKRAHRRASNKRVLQCLTTSFMNKDWQYNNPANPADAAIGPQLYDSHLYFAYGGVADPNPKSYMDVICNTDRVTQAYAVKNDPLVFGEWSLATNFNTTNPTDQFLHDWSDAQRRIYAGQADGWIFWSFKVEAGSKYSPAWSYFDALAKGYFSQDPSKLSNPNVCAPYI